MDGEEDDDDDDENKFLSTTTRGNHVRFPEIPTNFREPPERFEINNPPSFCPKTAQFAKLVRVKPGRQSSPLSQLADKPESTCGSRSKSAAVTFLAVKNEPSRIQSDEKFPTTTSVLPK